MRGYEEKGIANVAKKNKKKGTKAKRYAKEDKDADFGLSVRDPTQKKLIKAVPPYY